MTENRKIKYLISELKEYNGQEKFKHYLERLNAYTLK